MISEFAAALTDALQHEPLPPNLTNEQDLEQRVVVPVASRVAVGHPAVLVYTHPFGNKRRCEPACDERPPAGPGRVLGCPRCWAVSKAWASVAAFGTHHTFDLVARDGASTLALEIKFVSPRGGRMPNGEIQRFLGQCALAATRHDIVIGVFAHRGLLDDRWRLDTEVVDQWFQSRGIRLIFRGVELQKAE